MKETFLTARWENIIMANYEVNPEVLKAYLPKGVELDFYDNKTFVSLVGFIFKRTKIFNIPIPFLGIFEEINLRFYVKRTEGNTIKRGVVFINETVPYQAVAWLANKLYKEHYTAIPTKSLLVNSPFTKEIKYEWKINKTWNHLSVNSSTENKDMQPGSIEEFIFEHYYGYTKVNEQISQEYRVNHPRWQINQIHNYSIDCDFESMYGKDFSSLTGQKPHSVIISDGSAVSVDWKRTKF